MGGQLTAAVIVLLLVGMLLAMTVIPRFFLRKAVRDLIALFRKLGATSPAKAATPEDLGLVRGSLLDRAFSRRDYRPHAIRVLVQANVVKATDEGRLYLSEQELEQSPVKKFARIE